MARTPKDYEMSQNIQTPKPISTSNRYNAFQDFPALSYVQIAQPRPSHSPTNPTHSAANTSKEKSPYITKNLTEHITLTTFKETPQYSALKTLTQRLFPDGCY